MTIRQKNISNFKECDAEELTKDPFSWKVAFWDVTLKAGRGGLMHTE